ncbi:hypothetical protein O181_094727 [Austropuccinia psidii MF-1]|uniref:Uncharacterized protein n=1 Tax=Austropuccinia psidii MF-1 TaxID=1389203 RepID=A0A9Q3J3G3_9BASI|nr:hypothetical protein [Austropuccinia psidii MF-1]
MGAKYQENGTIGKRHIPAVPIVGGIIRACGQGIAGPCCQHNVAGRGNHRVPFQSGEPGDWLTHSCQRCQHPQAPGSSTIGPSPPEMETGMYSRTGPDGCKGCLGGSGEELSNENHRPPMGL